jgi:hypothetical protein
MISVFSFEFECVLRLRGRALTSWRAAPLGPWAASLGVPRQHKKVIKKFTQAETQHAPLRQHANIIRPQPGTVTQPHSLTAHSSHAERRNHDDAARGLGGGSAAPVTPKAEGRAERLASKELTSSDK